MLEEANDLPVKPIPPSSRTIHTINVYQC